MPAFPRRISSGVASRARRIVRSRPIPFVRVLPAMRRSDWVVIVAVWIGVAVASVGPAITVAERTRGVRVTPHDMLIGQLLDAVTWLVLLRPLLQAFDAAPFRRGARVRSVVVRLLVLAAAAAAHGLVNWSVIHTLGPWVVDDPPVIGATALVGLRAAVFDAVDALCLPLLVYVTLRVVLRRRERDRAAAASEVALRDARLHALTTDMRPHFLFNALNGIALLVRVQPKLAEEMIVQLADLLRATLDVGGRREQSLADELTHLEHYLSLQQMRFGARLTVHRDIDAAVLSALMPPMLLQPLAENALGHGIEPKPGPGTLRITARRDGESLVLAVQDDGVGVPTGNVCERIGLANTRERLALLYPGESSLVVEPALGGGTIAVVRLPFHSSPTVDASAPPVGATATATNEEPRLELVPAHARSVAAGGR